MNELVKFVGVLKKTCLGGLSGQEIVLLLNDQQKAELKELLK